ncbi:MAG: hypothetical protein ACTHQE_04175 [Thermomicrobiales bacterium]
MNHLLGYDAIQLPGIPSPFLHALIVIGITCAVMSPSATFMGAALHHRRRGIGIAGAALAWAVLARDLLGGASLLPGEDPAALIAAAICGILVVIGTAGVLLAALHTPQHGCRNPQPARHQP